MPNVQRGVGAGVAPVALLSLGLLTAGLLSGVPGPAPTSGVHVFASPWSHYDTGRVNVVYPSALPTVQLVQDANASYAATLTVDGIYELAPGGLPTPTVVAAAFPNSVAAFNGSASAGASGSPLALYANLEVFPVGLPLWAPDTSIGPTAGPVGSSTLAVAFSPTTSSTTSAGVSVNWTVVGWPWTSTADALAIDFSFDYATGGSLTACQSSPVASSVPACSGRDLAVGQSAWGSDYASLEGEGGAGPIAVLAWSPSIEFGAAPSPVQMGALAGSPGSSDLLLMGTNAGVGPVAGQLAFSLIAPTLSAVAHEVVGDPALYLATVALVGAGATAGVLGYRRYDRRTRNSL